MTLRSAPLPVSIPGLSPFHTQLLAEFEDFFASGEITSRVGNALRSAVQNYTFVDSEDEEGEEEEDDEKAQKPKDHATDHEGAQRNYGIFLEFADMIDGLVTEFVESLDVSKIQPKKQAAVDGAAAAAAESEETKVSADELMTKVAELCDMLVDHPMAGMFTSIPYVAAALDFGRFQELVYDHANIAAANVNDADDEEAGGESVKK